MQSRKDNREQTRKTGTPENLQNKSIETKCLCRNVMVLFKLYIVCCYRLIEFFIDRTSAH